MIRQRRTKVAAAAAESRRVNSGSKAQPARVWAVWGLTCLMCALLPVVAELSARPGAGSPKGAGSFEPGEKLLYRVEWNPPWYLFFLPSMEAGNVEVTLLDGAEYQNRKAYKIVFAARSSGALVKLAGFKIDDYYEFLTDPETFCTFSVMKREREGKRKRDIDIVYLPETRQLHIKEVNLATDPPKVTKDKFVDDVPACVKDVLSTLYALRMQEISGGKSIRSLVGDNEHFKQVESRVEKKEKVDTPSGKYDAWRLNTFALMGGLFREGGQFKIWLTADDRKLPVQFEAKVYLGKVTGKLTQFNPKAGQ